MTRVRRRSRWRARLVLTLMLAGLAWGGWEVWTWPRMAALAHSRPPTTAFIEAYRARQRALGRPGSVAWTWTPYAAISADLKRAVLVAEDINFFSHHGFELAELENALEDSLRDREPPRGASTITQQLVKNLWLSPSRNPWRKAKEAILTWQLERAVGKRRILELYLNVVEFGPGIFGAGAASQRYFGAAAGDLDESQAAQLAAGLPDPAAWHPGADSSRYRRRVALIQRRMARATFLSRQI